MYKVISLFDKSGVMVQPWLDNGYECFIYDIQHPPGTTSEGNLHKIGMDLSKPLEHKYEDVAFVSAFPPCTHLAVSGARWFKGKGLRKLAEAIELFATATEFCESTDAPYIIENPVSTISTYWRKPDHDFHPWMFTGYEEMDNYVKKTCLWVGNEFQMPDLRINLELGKPDNRIHMTPGGKKQADRRSITPLGFARAVYEANKC